MPSSFTPRLRLEMQAAGENLNTWGAPKLNNVIARLDFAVAGWTAIALTGDYSLAASNGDDEARSAMLKFSGVGAFAVTVPSVSKGYVVQNACSGVLTLTTGSGAAATLAAGEMAQVVCDGTNITKLRVTEFGGARITNVGDPVNLQDAATKAYVDAQVWNAQAGILPGQAGNAGKVLKTNGTTPSWAPLGVADLTDYATDQTAKANQAKAFAIAVAVAL